jgi:hypothetical protein
MLVYDDIDFLSLVWRSCEEEVEELPLSKMFYSNTARWLNDTLCQTNKWIAQCISTTEVLYL